MDMDMDMVASAMDMDMDMDMVAIIRHFRLRMWWESEDSIQWSSHWKDEL